ncbi:MAG: formate dehydrogenase accessory sulfurtransferase FdhD [Firmicutes bacterium]|nr:formate dehydrogenase accessory sulfurtransferase FdhD [Bacillota bacterium]
MEKIVVSKKILRVDDKGIHELDDPVIREVPLTIFLNGKELVTLLHTPERSEELAVGFLRSEGLIRRFADIRSLRFDQEQGIVFVETKGNELAEKLYGKRTITSGCGKGTVFYHALDALKSNPVKSEMTIPARQILALMRQLQERAELYQQTGGIHSSALGSKEGLLYVCEDIGRHNAVDKLIGHCLKEEIDLNEKVLLTSGRVSSEILIKTAKLSIPVLVSRSAPTELSIELAINLGITLIGFARGRRFNIYANQQRIQIN